MRRDVAAAFAELFSYPSEGLAASARRCAALTGDGELRDFVSWIENTRAGAIEEAYCASFELNPECPPYVGHHLCPEPERRNLFIAGLAEVYAMEGFRVRDELPDHLCEVLRFVASPASAEAKSVLLRDGLAPAVDRMRSTLKATPWGNVLDALSRQLTSRTYEEARP